MRRKSAIISLLIAFVMLFTVFAVNVPEAEAAVDKNTYWIKVNTQCNVITVYKKYGSEYKPIKAMVCSTGKKGHETPQGTFRMGTKIGWCKLVGNVWGRYSMVIKGNYLFHSVPYKKKSINSMKYNEYNKLGTNCSHGCVRLALMDVKWIWNYCPKGTKITIYKSEDPGPLGKPVPYKMKSSWKYDPTDPSKKNRHKLLKKPVISVAANKAKYVEKGSAYSLTSGVTAINPNAYQNLTYKVKTHKIYKYNSSKKKYVKIKKFSTKTVGSYKVKYKVYDYYCGGTSYKNFYFKVVNPEQLSIVANDREVILGTDDAFNAVKDVTAKQKSSDRTKTMTVSIIEPGAAEAIVLTYSEAQAYVFDKEGEYKITYSVKNYFSPYKKSTKNIIVKCIKPIIDVDSGTEEQTEIPIISEEFDQPIINEEE